MRGHEPIFAHRLKGGNPKTIYIRAGGEKTPLMNEEGEAYPDVQIDEGDSILNLDLRFTFKVVVIVTGMKAKLVEKIGEACVRAKAKRVICNYVEMRLGRKEVYMVTDTEGILAWESNEW